jgi:hypothetical protein
MLGRRVKQSGWARASVGGCWQRVGKQQESSVVLSSSSYLFSYNPVPPFHHLVSSLSSSCNFMQLPATSYNTDNTNSLSAAIRTHCKHQHPARRFTPSPQPPRPAPVAFLTSPPSVVVGASFPLPHSKAHRPPPPPNRPPGRLVAAAARVD